MEDHFSFETTMVTTGDPHDLRNIMCAQTDGVHSILFCWCRFTSQCGAACRCMPDDLVMNILTRLKRIKYSDIKSGDAECKDSS
jgi:hypothetical protein